MPDRNSRNRNSLRFRSWRNSAESPALDPRRSDNCHLKISSDGSYNGTYADKDGKQKEFGGGGIAINQDGSERSLTQEEIMEELNAPDIEYEKDGSVILYYKNQSIDITHKFNKDNICYVKLVDGDDSLYVTVKYNNGCAYSPNKYISPLEFN